MGLRADFTVFDLGYAETTEEMGVYIDYSYGCQAFAETFLNVAKDLVPVDTGYLRSTITASASDDGCCCETDCEYAEYVEYGTVYMGAQPYFEPAISAALDAAYPYWDEAVDLALEEEEMLLEEMEESEGGGGRSGRGGGGILGRGIGGFIGGLLGMFVIAFITATISFLFSGGDSGRGGGGGLGRSFGGGGDLKGYGDGITVEITQRGDYYNSYN